MNIDIYLINAIQQHFSLLECRREKDSGTLIVGKLNIKTD